MWNYCPERAGYCETACRRVENDPHGQCGLGPMAHVSGWTIDKGNSSRFSDLNSSLSPAASKAQPSDGHRISRNVGSEHPGSCSKISLLSPIFLDTMRRSPKAPVAR